MIHWSWADWYMLGHKSHPLDDLKRWVLGRGLRLALAVAVGFAICAATHAQNLKVVELGPGAHPGFDVGFAGWSGWNRKKLPNPRELIDEDGNPYDGYHFIGAGREHTHILPDAPKVGWVGTGPSPVSVAAGATVFVGKGCGIIRFEALTLHSGPRMGIHMGEIWDQVSPLEPSVLQVYDARLTADPPPPGGKVRAKWGVLTYNTDVFFTDVELDLAYQREHNLYAHGAYRRGIFWQDVDSLGSGAEGLKVSTRPHEVAFVPGMVVVVRDCYFTNWMQPWSDRGGGGVVLQGSGASRILIERTRFRGKENARGACLMIDDGGGIRTEPDGSKQVRFYDVDTGATTGKGPANGDILIRHSGFVSGPGPPSFKEMLRVGTIAPIGQDPIVAKSVTIEGSGFFGQNRLVRISNAGPINVRQCNTPRLIETAQGRNVPTEHEAMLTVQKAPFRPMSEGWDE